MSKSVLSDLDLGGTARILNLPAPASDNEPARMADLNRAVEGLAWKDSVRVASTANINLTAPGASIGGINMAANDSFLAKDQTAPAENGIYIWNGAAIPATRHLNANTADELEQAVVSIEEGASANATFRQTSVNFTLGTGAVVWAPFGSSAAAASETLAGTIEIATQVEADAGTDDVRAITPKKMAEWSGRKLKATAPIGDGSATSFAVNHNFNTRDVTVGVYRNSGNYDEVMCDIERTNLNTVTLKFAVAPAATALRVVIIA
ncbi:hypothetical protein MMA231_02482 [Asticcacaulis sp. MM231]|uniref:hypothetical protein n=1 Tax=Asticcacaulis sp. MM231 TaxID=3157666 RepID=UPI0032D56FF8